MSACVVKLGDPRCASLGIRGGHMSICSRSEIEGRVPLGVRGQHRPLGDTCPSQGEIRDPGAGPLGGQGSAQAFGGQVSISAGSLRSRCVSPWESRVSMSLWGSRVHLRGRSEIQARFPWGSGAAQASGGLTSISGGGLRSRCGSPWGSRVSTGLWGTHVHLGKSEGRWRRSRLAV